MRPEQLWASLEDALALCANDDAGLSHPLHFEYETHEPPGTLAFDALLALIDALPMDLQQQAVALALERLSALPAHLRREVANDTTLPILANSPAWPLVRSLTFTGDESGSSFITVGEPRLSALEHIQVDTLQSEAVDCLNHLSQFGALRAVEAHGFAAKNDPHLPNNWIETLQRLPQVVNASERELENVPRWQLRKVELRATARAIELLEQRNTRTLEDCSFFAIDEDADAALDALLNSKNLLSGLKSLSIKMDMTDDQFARLVSCPELSQLEQLSIHPFISQRVISPAAIGSLARAPFLSRLSSLSLSDQPLTAAGWQSLSRVPFERLTSLDLTRTKGGAAGMAALLNARWFAGVQRLDVTQCDIGPEGAESLANSEAIAGLVSLKLGGNGIHNKGAAELAAARHFQSLREVHMGDIGLWGFGELTRAGWFHALETILVGAVEDGAEIDALQTFATSGEFPSLVSLKFGYHATDQGLRSLAKAQNLPRLRHLNLQHNNELTARGIGELVSSPLLSKIWVLNLYSCPVGDEGAKLLASSGVCRELTNLNVWCCGMTLAGSAALAQADLARTLRWLNIDGDLVQPWLESNTANPLLRARLARSG